MPYEVSRIHESPIGPLLLTANGAALTGLYMAPHPENIRGNGRAGAESSVLDGACQQLDEFFAGARLRFDLPLKAQGSEFQKRVWQALGEIEYGQTKSYSDIAAAIGRPGAARAVGSANARNPISIIVPCHRVIAADGGLAGYGGGTERKQWLLTLEGAWPRQQQARVA